jgi:hypothetical protein
MSSENALPDPPVLVLTPAPRAEWRRVFEVDPFAVPDQSPEFTAAACALSKWVDASRFYTFADGRRFVLPLLRHRWSARAGSMPPALGLGGLVGAGVDSDVATAVMADVRSAHFSTRIRPNPLLGALWRTADGATSTVPMRAHVVSLDGGPDAVWRRMRRSGREGIKRARRAGLEVVVDEKGTLIPEFRRLMERSVRRWAAQQREPQLLARVRAATRDPKGELETLASTLGSRCRLVLARLDGVPVAGNIVLIDGNAHGTRAAMDKELAHPSRINYLLVWSQLEAAAKAGCRWFHMGESGHSQSIAEFKERFGAIAYDYAACDIERIPLNRIDRGARSAVKRMIRFRD